MALVPFTGTISAATLNANFGDSIASLNTNAVPASNDFDIVMTRANLATADDVTLRSLAFTPTDDWELRALRVTALATLGTGQVVTATLTVDNGDSTYLIGQTPTASCTIAATGTTTTGNADYTLIYLSRRLRLLKGVRYRLTLSTTGAIFLAQAFAVVRSQRRRA